MDILKIDPAAADSTACSLNVLSVRNPLSP